jgi:hypothetical protein
MFQPKELLDPIGTSKDVSTWIKHDGFLIVFGSIVLVFGTIFMAMWLHSYWNRTNKAQHDHPKASDLLNHPFFGTMEFYMKTKVLGLSLPEKGREAIFRDFLKIKFHVFTTNVYSWLLKYQATLDSMTPEALHNEMLKLLAESVFEYEEQAFHSGIPQIVVDKFRQFHNPHVDSVVSGIYNICQCEWIISTNTEKLGFILNSLTNAFDTTLVDAEVVLCDINGELDGIVYKGITVMPYKRMKKANYQSNAGTSQA